MELLPKEIADRLPALYAQEDQSFNAIAHVKFFTPDSSFTWYITEYDGNDTFFGLVDSGHDKELGYFTLSEIQTLRGAYGLPVERDLHFKPTPIKQFMGKEYQD